MGRGGALQWWVPLSVDPMRGPSQHFRGTKSPESISGCTSVPFHRADTPRRVASLQECCFPWCSANAQLCSCALGQELSCKCDTQT